MTQDSSPKDKEHRPESQDSEWTYVKRKSRRNKTSIIPPKAPAEEVLSERPPRTTDLRSVEELGTDYRNIRAQFEELGLVKKLRELVAENFDTCRQVSRAVNFGVGSFDPENGSWSMKRSTYFQLSAFLVMVEEIEKVTGNTIKCIFQEPVFTKSDVDFIASLGHEVIDAPKGAELIDENTFFFGVHLYRAIYADALKKHLPAIYVGTDWDTWYQTMNTEGIEMIEEMDQKYKRSPFPKNQAAFSNTCIYWRPSDLEDKKEEEKVAGSDEKNSEEALLVGKMAENKPPSAEKSSAV